MKPIQVLDEARDSVSSLHVVGHEIVSGCGDGRMRVYDLRMGMIFVDVIGRMYTESCVSLSPLRMNFGFLGARITYY